MINNKFLIQDFETIWSSCGILSGRVTSQYKFLFLGNPDNACDSPRMTYFLH